MGRLRRKKRWRKGAACEGVFLGRHREMGAGSTTMPGWAGALERLVVIVRETDWWWTEREARWAKRTSGAGCARSRRPPRARARARAQTGGTRRPPETCTPTARRVCESGRWAARFQRNRKNTTGEAAGEEGWRWRGWAGRETEKGTSESHQCEERAELRAPTSMVQLGSKEAQEQKQRARVRCSGNSPFCYATAEQRRQQFQASS